MRRRLFIVLALASIYLCAASACAAAGSGNAPRRGQGAIELLSFKASVGAGTFSFEGKLTNAAAVPLRGAKLVFTLLDANKKTVATRRAPIEPAEIVPGEETAFAFETKADDLSVAVRVEAVDDQDRAVAVTGGGPFPIE
jgi:hypothetical protein